MGIKKYLLSILLCCCWLLAWSQEKPSAPAEDGMDSLLTAGNWKAAIIKGNQLLKNGDTGMELKIGFARFMCADYGGALNNYDAVLKTDPNNITAHYYLYLCYLYLNNDAMVGYHLASLDSTSLKLLNAQRTQITGVRLESSFKIAEDDYRGNASYTKFDLSNRLCGKLQVDMAVSYFGQYIYDYRDNKWRQTNDRQTEYFLKLSYPLLNRLTLFGGWHYAYTQYENRDYNSNLFVAGLNYTSAYFNLQGDFDAGRLITDQVTEYSARVQLNPLGNLNLYFISGIAYLHKNGTDNFIPTEGLGFKTAKNIWLETSANFGNMDDYIDAAGLYIYNTFDATKLKLAETGYIQLTQKLMLNLNYTYEQKKDNVNDLKYNQHSIAAGLQWKF